MRWIRRVIAIYKYRSGKKEISSIYINIPKRLADSLGLKENDHVEITLKRDTILVRKVR